MDEQCYGLGPLTLRVQTDNQRVQQQLARGWGQLFQLTPITMPTAIPDGTAAGLTINLAATPTAPPALLGNQPALVRYGPLSIWQTSAGFDLGMGDTWLAVAHGAAAGHLADDFWVQPLVMQRDFWQRLFFLLSRFVNCHLLHANALLPPTPGPAGGLLLVGDCGAGKTTLTMSLIAAGWRYVTDDNVLLQPTAGGVMAYAVRRGFACTVQTATAWPWLAPAWAAGVRLNRWKTLVDLDALYPLRYQPTCRPGLILFPQIAHAAQSTLTPLTAMQAFTTLLGQQQSGLLVEPTALPTLLTLYQTLVTQCRGFQFHAGTDVFHDPPAVSALLLETLATTNPSLTLPAYEEGTATPPRTREVGRGLGSDR